jgi:glycosyltransferase involved in cell wall biosynthesis
VEIPHHVVEAPRTPRDEARRALRLPLDRPVAASLGVVTPAKRVGKILEALAGLPKGRRPFLFVGGAVGDDDPLHRYVDAHGLSGDVAFGGYLSDDDFWRAASAADFGVNLRHPTMGETSGAVCRLAGFGLPLVVSDTGWFRELPDTFASKVPVGGDEVPRLAAAMEALAFDPERTRARSAAAVAWGEARRPDRIADAYADVLREAAEGLARPRGLRGLVASGLVEVGVGRAGSYGATSREPDAMLVAAVASRVAPVLPDTIEEKRFS